MTLKWCYSCEKDKLLREFYGPTEHKNALCISCYNKATNNEYRNLGFSELGDE